MGACLLGVHLTYLGRLDEFDSECRNSPGIHLWRHAHWKSVLSLALVTLSLVVIMLVGLPVDALTFGPVIAVLIGGVLATCVFGGIAVSRLTDRVFCILGAPETFVDRQRAILPSHECVFRFEKLVCVRQERIFGQGTRPREGYVVSACDRNTSSVVELAALSTEELAMSVTGRIARVCEIKDVEMFLRIEGTVVERKLRLDVRGEVVPDC